MAVGAEAWDAGIPEFRCGRLAGSMQQIWAANTTATSWSSSPHKQGCFVDSPRAHVGIPAEPLSDDRSAVRTLGRLPWTRAWRRTKVRTNCQPRHPGQRDRARRRLHMQLREATRSQRTSYTFTTVEKFPSSETLKA